MRILARILSVTLFAVLTVSLSAQKISNYRPYDQNGVNMFEAPKQVDAEFDGIKVKIGGSFTQQYQGLSHSNNATPRYVDNDPANKDLNKLYPLGKGFNLATANLNLDFLPKR